jgi:FAD:protein FMN transferase
MKSATEPGERVPAGQVVSLSAPAMACEFVVQFPSTQPDRQFAMEAFEWIERLEEQLSVYRETSEVSEINRTSFEKPVRVEPMLFRLVQRCRMWWEESEQAFDVTAGPIIKAWGFFHRQGRTPSETELSEAFGRVGMGAIRLDESQRTIQFEKPGMEINLGAVGKGYALDSVAGRLRRVGYRELLLGAGSSSVLAIGHPPWDESWTVDLRHPLDRNRPIALVRLANAGLSTSGVAEQSFELEGKRFGHVLDPRTGRPVQGMLQATAIATDAAEAEALSTAFFVNGVEWTSDFCRRRPDVGALIIPESPPGRELHMEILGRMRDFIVLPSSDGRS